MCAPDQDMLSAMSGDICEVDGVTSTTWSTMKVEAKPARTPFANSVQCIASRGRVGVYFWPLDFYVNFFRQSAL